MRIIAKKTLNDFSASHPRAKGSLDSWFIEAKHAVWKTPSDIKSRFPSVSFLKDNRVFFNISGNKYRVLCRIRYESGIIFILFVGTHADYDKIDATNHRYRSKLGGTI
ncbi:MAG: type II toxin-antitoxin system HigB family toxin [Spirochaetaceae bacterium]|nr:type II toxin-antitoxin system HigB family toxin [Spirochaetaceae bacterium]MDT8297393.1 type II toxin-antitoxin system HigB family toxin [Spirochaetaceae bacterium]